MLVQNFNYSSFLPYY